MTTVNNKLYTAEKWPAHKRNWFRAKCVLFLGVICTALFVVCILNTGPLTGSVFGTESIVWFVAKIAVSSISGSILYFTADYARDAYQESKKSDSPQDMTLSKKLLRHAVLFVVIIAAVGISLIVQSQTTFKIMPILETPKTALIFGTAILGTLVMGLIVYGVAGIIRYVQEHGDALLENVGDTGGTMAQIHQKYSERNAIDQQNAKTVTGDNEKTGDNDESLVM